MSVKVMAVIWDHFPEGGGALLTALALADKADHDGSSIYPKIDTVARMTQQDRRTVQRHMAHMQDIGWLVMDRQGGGRGKTTIYRIPIECLPLGVVGRVANLRPLQDADSASYPQKSRSYPQAPERAAISTQRVASDTQKGGIAMSHRTSLPVHINKTVFQESRSTPIRIGEPVAISTTIKAMAEALRKPKGGA